MVQEVETSPSVGDLDALIRDRVDAMVTARVDELLAIRET